MESLEHLNNLLRLNNHTAYYSRKNILMQDCEDLCECRKDYWTYEHYAAMLEHTASTLRREAKKVREDIKHGEK